MARKTIKNIVVSFAVMCLFVLSSYNLTLAFKFDVSSLDASSFDARSAGETSVALGLDSGWNFISIPIQPKDASINAVLKDIYTNVKIVWGYDNQNKQWLKYKPGAAGQNTLIKIDAGIGYWVYLESPADLMISGINDTDGVFLFTGWNLVGYVGNDDQALNASYMASSLINDWWTIMWNWEKGEWRLKAVDSNGLLSVPTIANLNRGRAYWIKIKSVADAVQWQQQGE